MHIKNALDIIWLDKTTSTSDHVRATMDSLHHGSVVAAGFQSAGRGQGDHIWQSERGENLTFSVLFKYDGQHGIMASEQQILTMAISLAIVDYLASCGVKAQIKKPNDIYVGRKKICGMLIENGLMGGQMTYSIVGVGLNINQTSFPADLPNAVSLANLTGRRYDTHACLSDVLGCILARFDAIWVSPAGLEKAYTEKLVTL